MRFWPFGKRARRARAKAGNLPPEARELFASRFRFWQWLSPEERTELESHVRVLLVEKRFEGAGGFVVDDETRWLVLAQAALLLLHRETDYFPGVQSIVIYPKAFLTPVRHALDGGAVLEDTEERAGESWGWGTVILARDEIEEGLRSGDRDGYNVVIHEFAHALDRENGEEDGMPLLRSDAARARWAKAFTPAFEALREEAGLEEEPDTFLDPYGAESPAEFFAVAVESFFESPDGLRDSEPAIYAVLAEYFQQYPAEAQERLLASRPGSSGRVGRGKARRPRVR